MVEWLHGDLSISNGAFLVLMILAGMAGLEKREANLN